MGLEPAYIIVGCGTKRTIKRLIRLCKQAAQEGTYRVALERRMARNREFTRALTLQTSPYFEHPYIDKMIAGV